MAVRRTRDGGFAGASAIDAARRLPRALHGDQRGTISILSVFAVLLLAMLLGMVMNVGRHLDGKVRMQNSADAAAYSGAVVLTRGMNDLAFTNHLLCDVFALTAFLREARDRNAQSFTPSILAAWNEAGAKLSQSGFEKFEAVGAAIVKKVPLERQLVNTYSDWVAAASEIILPVMEEVLAEELIPQYQRAVVLAVPGIAQTAARETAWRNGQPAQGRGEMLGVLWRASGQMVGGDNELANPTLPVVDPVFDTSPEQFGYRSAARHQRDELAGQYLRDWNHQAVHFFDRAAKMCQFAALWRSFTCGQLRKLLNEEYPNRNLPHLIRKVDESGPIFNTYLERNFVFIATVHWRRLPELMPGLFRNRLEGDSVAYAEVHMFVPRRRLVWQYHGPASPSPEMVFGGIPGEDATVPMPDQPAPDNPGDDQWVVGREMAPTHWDLLNQHWTCQLAPATQPTIGAILQTPPGLAAGDGNGYRPPVLDGLNAEDVGRISPH